MKRFIAVPLTLCLALAMAAPAIAQTGPDQWSEPPGVPSNVYYGSGIVATDSNTLYVAPGNNSTLIYRYTISTSTWTAMTPAPLGFTYGGSFTHMPGTNFIYASRGGNTNTFYRFDFTTGLGTWTVQAVLPFNAYYGTALSATATTVYAFQGWNTQGFWQFNGTTWTAAASTPVGGTVYLGSALSYPGSGDFIYGLRGNASTTFWRYSISGNSWTVLATVPLPVYYGGCLAAGPAGTLYCYRGYNSTSFYSYNIAGNSWTTLVATPGTVSYGGGIAYPFSGDLVFSMRGNNTTDWWKYSISQNKYVTTMNSTPAAVYNGSSFIGVGDGVNMYATQGNSSTAFWHYNVTTDTWTPKATTPAIPGYGACLTWTGGDFIYLTQGNYTTTFWRYSISANSWNVQAPTPTQVYYGGAIAWGGANYIFGCRGYYTTEWWRYNTDSDIWEVMAVPPSYIGQGGAMAWTGGDTMYVFQGAGLTSFWAYSIAGDSWSVKASIPLGVSYGGSIVYPGSGYNLFAWRGNNSPNFYSYNYNTDSWSVKANAPGLVYLGSCLGYPGSGKYVYALRGNSTPQVWRYWMDSIAPADPTGVNQLYLPGSPAIAQGATLTEPGLKFTALANDPDNNGVKLQVEVKPNPGTFDGLGLDESPWMAAGSTITVTKLSVPNGSYQWRCRVMDMTEKTSNWVNFGAAGTDFAVSAPAGGAPTAPTVSPQTASIGQFRLDEITPIAVGALTNEKGVVFKGSATDPNSNAWRLQVELKPAGVAFTGTTNLYYGEFAASGQISKCIINPITDGDWRWQARAVDSFGNASAFSDFGANGTVKDFSLLVNVPPSLPTLLAQLRTATLLPIGVGGGSYEGNVTFQGVVNDPNSPDTVKLQVELKAVGTPFDGTGLIESGLIANGATASVAVTGLATSSQWHWRARCVDINVTTGPWLAFGNNPEANNDFTVTIPPNDPTTSGPGALGQYKFDEVTVIPAGGSTPENAFVVKGMVVSPSGADLRLQVECKPVGTLFNNAVTAQSPVTPSGGTATVFVSGLANGNYQWRARAIEDLSLVTSSWVDFGGNISNPPQNPADTDIQITFTTNSAPNPPPTSGPGAMTQYKYDGFTIVPVGGDTPDPGVIVKATITDPNTGTTLRLEVECEKVGTPFTGNNWVAGPYVLSGSVAQIKIDWAATTGEIYHWRARTRDSSNAVSAWVSFGGNTENDADFKVVLNNAPFNPFNLLQGKLDDTVAIPEGGSTTEPGIRLVATASDSDAAAGDLVQIEFEIKQTSVAFDGSATIFSDFVVPGNPVFKNVIGLTQGNYHWRCRAKDSKGAVSAGWTDFGAAPDGTVAPYSTDFVVPSVASNNPPNAPTGLGQFTLADSPVATGGTTVESAIRCAGTVSDPDAGTSVGMEIEIRKIDTDWSGVTNATPFKPASGAAAVVDVLGLANASYHWRARSVDAWGATSVWVVYGGNNDNSPPTVPADIDFTVAAPNAAPANIVDTTLAQYKLDATTLVNPGGSNPQSGMVFKGVVDDTDSANTVRMQVQLKPSGSAFTGSETIYYGTFVSPGSVSTVTATGLSLGTYIWRARAEDNNGATSAAWTDYNTAVVTTVDFQLIANTPPGVPSGVGQFKQVGDPLPVGGVSDISGVVVKATLSDPTSGDKIRLQVEMQLVNVAFTNSPTHVSAEVNTGQQVTLSITGLVNGNYHWQYRAIDSNDDTSAWTVYGGNLDSPLPAEIDFIVLNNALPNPPTGLDQVKLDGATTISIGEITDEAGWKVIATVSDPDTADTVKLQVEAKPIGTAFDGIGIVESAFVSNGSIATATVSVSNGQYQWRARAMDNNGVAGGWIDFGANAPNPPQNPADTDVEVFSNASPNAPASIGQFKADTTTVIAAGADTDESTVVFKGTVSDSDSGDTLKLEVEVKAVGVAFTNTPTAASVAFVANGAVASATVSGLAAGNYHWQARAIDNNGGTGSWLSFGTNPDNISEKDFGVNLGAAPTMGAPTQHDEPADAPAGVGYVDPDSSFTFKAQLNDTDGGATIQLQVEAKLVSLPFDGLGLVTGASVTTGQTGQVTASSLPDGSYHWRARAIDNTGQTSAWVSGMANSDGTPPTPPADTDFTIDAVNDPPVTPTSVIQSDTSGGGAQPTTYIDNDGTVFFSGIVSDPNSGIGQQVRLQVEIKATGIAFDGTSGLNNGGLVNSGNTSEVSIALADGTYHWRARALDALGTPSSGWFVFGGNNDPDDVDLTVDAVNDNPADITSAIQSATSMGPAQPVGYVHTANLTMYFRAVVSDPNSGVGQQVQVEVEVKATGVAFTSTGTVLGTLVNSGQESEATVLLPGDNTYHWQIRARDAAGATSAWFAFGGNGDPNGIDFTINATNVAPTISGGVGQFMLDGTTPIAIGADSLENGVILKATVADTDPGDTIIVEAEVQLNGTPLSGTPNWTGSASVSTGVTASVTVQPLVTGNYHWAIRAKDAGGLTSAWFYFNVNDMAIKDFGISLGTAPSFASGPTQHDTPAGPSLPAIMISTDTSVTFKASASDPDAGQTMTFEVEIKPTNTAFNGLSTLTTTGAIGATLTITTTVATDGDYHWRARLTDSNSLSSAWVNFGGQPEPNNIDFQIDAVATAPPAPTGAQQYRSNGSTVIAAGAVTTENTVVFKATVTDTDPSNTVQLAVEYAPAGTSFAGAIQVLGTSVTSGSISTVTVNLLTDGNYEWRYFAKDSTGLNSSTTEFQPGGLVDFIIDFVQVNPGVPASIQQYKANGTTVIGIGAITDENTVVIKGTVTDADPSNTIQLVVEYAPAGTGFAGFVQVLSPAVTSGQTATVTINPIADGSYEWRYFAKDSTGNNSSVTEFQAGGAADFIVDFTQSPPATPTAVQQYKNDGTTVIAAGAVTTENTVVIKGTVTDVDPSNTIQLVVEYAVAGTSFASPVQVLSASVSSGQVATVTISGLSDGGYEWRYRALDSTALTSATTEFAVGGAADFIIDFVQVAPSTPASVGQFLLNGTTPIPFGGVTTENGVVIKATLNDVDPSNTIQLVVEYALAGTGFASPTTVNSVAVSPGQEATVTINGLADNGYEWRYRALDSTALTSATTQFNAAATADFIVDFTQVAPGLPTGVDQYKADTTTVIAAGAITTENTVVVKGTVTDADPSNTIQLVVEYAVFGTGFASPVQVLSPAVNSGQIATVTIPGIADGAYEWRYFAKDSTGTNSSVTQFPPNVAADFIVDFTQVAPSVPASVGQFMLNGTTPIATGAATTENGVVIKATLNDADPSNTIQLVVEYALAGTGFAAPTLVTSTAVSSGQVATVTLSLLADNSYEWRYRALDSTALFSATTEFVAGGAADFIIDAVNTTPPLPAGGTQHDSAVTGAELPGFTDDDNSMTFKCNVSDADPSQTVAIQVEIKGNLVAFDDTGLQTGSFVPFSGGQSVLTVSGIVNGDYHWRYRAIDSTGAVSAWIEFDPAVGADFTINVIGATPTVTGGTLAQHDESATPSVPEGYIDLDNQFVFKATLNDADGGTVKLRVEIKPQASSFDGSTNITDGAFVAVGATAEVVVPGIADGSYKWRVQAVDPTGLTSGWVEFAANGNPDFLIDFVNDPPATVISAIQADITGGNNPVGFVDNDNTMFFRAVVTDTDPSNQVRVEVEVKLNAVAFDGLSTVLGNLVSSGGTSEAQVTGLADGLYHWRIRAVDSLGLPQTGWFEFDPAAGADFIIEAVASDPAMSVGPTQHPDTASAAVPAGYVKLTDGNMTFKATVTDVDFGATAAIQVEIKANATAFDDLGLVTGTMVSTGNVSEVTVTKPAGNYMWRARAIDNTGAVGPWVEFDPPNGPDYTINGPPALPAIIGQFMLDTTTAIVAGGTTTEAGVVFKATVSDPEGHQCKLEVELQPNSGSFSGANNTPVAPLVNSGSVSTISVSGLTDNSYKWRYRVVDQHGAATAWTDFPPGDPDFIVNSPANTVPNDPASLSQHKADTITIIAPGATTNEDTVNFKAVVTDPDGDQCKIEVEVQPIGVSFTGTPTTAVNPLVASGGTAIATVTGLTGITSYHWQVRVVDSNGAVSGWISFGTNPDNISEVDFTVDTSLNTVPDVPASLGQFKLDTTTPIAIGTSTNENGVVFKATITDPDANLVKLMIEVQPNSTSFTGTATAQSALMATGSVAIVTVSGLADGAYHWRAWVVDSAGGASPFTPYGGNPDFIIDVTNVAPDLPTADTQLRTDGITVIPDGGTTNQTQVIFRATVTDADFNQVALQVEVVPNGSGFSGTPTSTSPFVVSGGSASLTVSGLTTLTDYKWRFRAIDPIGATSAWSDHAVGDPDFSVDTNNAPNAPTALAQFKLDGTTVIANGAITNESGYTGQANVTDPDAGDTVRVQVEVRLSASPFLDTPSATSTPVASGANASVQVTGLVPGSSYKWQARTIDAGGKTSGWVAFGAIPAFSIAANVNPDIAAPTQNRGSSGQAINVGERVYDETSVIFQSMVNDAGGETVSLEIEVQPVGTAFLNAATLTSGLRPSGTVASVNIALGQGRYHWQFRTVDASANATAWSSFGANPETSTDFELIPAGGSTNNFGCKLSSGAAGQAAWLLILAFLVLVAALRRRSFSY